MSFEKGHSWEVPLMGGGLSGGSLAHGPKQNSDRLAREATTALILVLLLCELYLMDLTCQQSLFHT